MLRARGKLRRISSGYLLINVVDCVYIYIYIPCIILYNGAVVAYVPTLLIFDYYVTAIIQLSVFYRKLC